MFHFHRQNSLPRTSRFPILPLLCCLLFAGTAQAQDANSDLESRVDAVFSEYGNEKIPGAAVAVLQGDSVVFSKGYGSANLEYDIPITPDKTIFHVASVSKQFTVYAIMLLEAEGKLSLDDPIQKHIPEVPDFGTPITLRHLATHTSGMRDQWSLLQLAGWRMDDVITVPNILKLVSRQQDLNFEPGSQYTYCNTGFTLLAETVARISGKTFADFCKDEMFRPLKMYKTQFYDDHEKVVPNRAYSYYQSGLAYRKSVLNYANAGATSLFTTAEDLMKWAAHLNNPQTERDQKIVAQMNTLAVLNDGETFGGAYGQFVGEYKGLKEIQHGGADAGYRSYLVRFPDQDFAVAVASNRAQANPGALAYGVVDIFLEDVLESELEAEAETTSEEVTAYELSEDELEAFAGYYWYEGGRTYRKIYRRENRLVYSRTNGPENELLPISKNEFKMLEVPGDIVVEFGKHKGKEALIFKDDTGETVMEAFDYVEGSPEVYQEYTGKYYSPELDVYYTLLLDDERLIARHNRLPDVPVNYTRKDDVNIGYTSAHFVRDANGKVSGMLVSTGRVTDLKFEKLD
ncbi:CubicO group peptidase, beta-lactamase class C family [Robiginitalea myxolifaciens]|uniref:CubicO group peptidase, beta-lactamase class C family n=1 Tax=Robiginitalea myxolifaciens TaxID=400055 RepID=A0A1I6G0I4_9FLAO|nr:serine hydrolase domain-containing protein [Robiginitalea myxolifaciens]SFR35723.1 CubicO group peptidase, beta-lactamase class C family [Robiginitalea myxolifaciens]